MMFHTQCILRLVVGVCVLYSALALEKGVDIFTLAAGCFWSVELVFQRIPGVVSTQVGYCGGKTETPSYAAVSRGTTGHAEAVQVQFDPTVVSLDQLLDVFFEIHDPTTPNAQGHDKGTQYRSALFFADEVQETAMKRAISKHQASFASPIVTEVSPLTQFWPGEEYHQRFESLHALPRPAIAIATEFPSAVVLLCRFLEKGGQSAAKGSLEPIQCYGNRGPIKNVASKPAFLKVVKHVSKAATANLYREGVKRDL